MGQKEIVIKGCTRAQPENVDLTIPRDELVVITGLSGSGKSSLAFDTMYAEGQRRYVESLSSYARMFLGQMSKPDLDSIDGLSPAGVDRSEDHLAQSSLDGGHDHRDLRLPPPALRARGRSALSRVRPRDQAPDDRSGDRRHPRACERGRRLRPSSWRRWSWAARGVHKALRRRAERGFHQGPRRRRDREA